MRLTQLLLKRGKDQFKLNGENFKYWKRFVFQEQAKNFYGPDVYRHPLIGPKSHADSSKNWYYTRHAPYSFENVTEQQYKPKDMPTVKPIKEWEIFLGDRVEVLVGPDKGKIGEVIHIVKERNWCFVEGLHMFKRGVQPDYSNPGGFSNILAQEEPLLVTHEVKLIDPSDRKKTDIVWRYTDEGERIRVSVRTGRIIPMPILHLHTWEDGTNDMKKIIGENDTDVVKVKEETFQPKLCTFEEDICESMGIKYQPIKSRGYKY